MYLVSVYYFDQRSRETFLVLSEKEYEIYIETWGHLNSLFSFCFFKLLLCYIPHDFFGSRCEEDRLNHPILITVALLLFKLEDKKELHEEVNWQHSKFYIMPQATEPFCHTILFCQIQYVMV